MIDLLDQADIDALVTASSSEGEGGARARASGPSPSRLPPLPEHYRLAAGAKQLERIRSLSVPVTVRLAERSMSLDEILEMTVGTIIEFNRSAEAELDLLVGDIPIGTGNAVKCGETFGLRVITIEAWARRLLSLGLLR